MVGDVQCHRGGSLLDPVSIERKEHTTRLLHKLPESIAMVKVGSVTVITFMTYIRTRCAKDSIFGHVNSFFKF